MSPLRRAALGLLLTLAAVGFAAASASAEEAASIGLLPGALRSDAPISIQSDELEIIQQDAARELVFTRNVRVVQADMVLRSERLEAFYPKGSSQPERMVAVGNVSFRRGDRHARCDRAVYTRSNQLLVCTGNAELSQGCDRIRGDEIRFDMERDHARVVGSPSVLIYPEGTSCSEETS